MKKLLLGCVAAASFAVSAEEAQNFDHYNDWKLDIFPVASTNNGNDVRVHFDLTQPLHGPWLTNPRTDAMTVSFQSRANCGAAVEYREKGTDAWRRQWRLLYGLVDFADDLHTFHLSGLRPGTVYEYRFVCVSDRNENAYDTPVTGREIWEFRTLDEKRGDYKVFVTTDEHGSARLFLDYQYGRSGAKDADLYIFLGDNVEDCMSQSDFYVTSGFLDYAVALWAKYRPSLFLRGNHDCWGLRAANGWARWYERPDGKGYYTARHGDALFIVFDVPTAHQRKQRDLGTPDYLEEELEWYRRLRTTDEWKTAKWRIALCHYGTRCASGFVDGWVFRDRFGGALNGEDGGEPIDLLLCGDAHCYVRNLAKSSEYFHNQKYDKKKPYVFKPGRGHDPNRVWNFAEVCNTVHSAAILEIGAKRLRYVDHDYREPSPSVPLDEFVLEK